MDFFQAYLYGLYLCVLNIEPIRSAIATETSTELLLPTGRLLELLLENYTAMTSLPLNSSPCVVNIFLPQGPIFS